MSYILLTWLLAPLWWPISLFRKLLSPQPKRILILEIAGIGDVVCSTHLFKQLRMQYPDAEIALVVDPIAETLAPMLTMIDQVISFPYTQQKGMLGRLRLARLYSSYDTGISLIPGAAQLVGFCWAAMPRRLSILPSPLNNSYRCLRCCLSVVEVHQNGTYFLETQARLFARLGVANPDISKWLPRPIVTNNPNRLDAKITRIGMLVSSGRSLKRIQLEKLQEIVIALLTMPLSSGAEVILIGGPADQALAQSLLAKLPEMLRPQVQNTVGYFKLHELPAQLQQLSLLVGVDSGVTHMADALGVPTVCVAGPVDLREVYQPGDTRQQIMADLPCYPCSTVFDTPAVCRMGNLACIKALRSEDIVKSVFTILEIKS